MDKATINNSSDSVFSLITNLCERFTNHPLKIKSYRSLCYEYLLGKKLPIYRKEFRDVQNTNDPYVKLLSWNFILVQDFDRADLAEKIEKAADNLKCCYNNDLDSYNRILQFLLNLRSVPQNEDNDLDLSALPNIDNMLENFNELFRMPTISELEDYSLDLKPKKVNIKRNQMQSRSLMNEEDEGYFSPLKEDVWDIAVKTKPSKRRTWENFGFSFPNKEKPFISELGELSFLWVDNLHYMYLLRTFPSSKMVTSKLKPKKLFLRDLKQVLVGISSDSFLYDDKNGFALAQGLAVEGLAPDVLESFSSHLMFCGTCYKALESMATPDPGTREYRHPGFIFKEFCIGISRYLNFYRTAVFSIPDTTNFLEFHNKVHQILVQVATLASICKVGPYATDEIPQGVALLNYLYQKVLNLSDRNILLVLYSILYPCCQVYFRHFLQQWILEGTVNDPYGEFFVYPNRKYIHCRGRTYWAKGFSVCQDIVPDFLIDLKDDILICGKIMNLLKICYPMSKLNIFLMGKKLLIFSCCLTQDQLMNLQQNATSYYLEASAECGPKFSLEKVINGFHEQDPIFMQLIAKKRAATLRRLELERQKLMQEKQEKKMEELTTLKEQYDAVLEQKQFRILRDIEREIKVVEENILTEALREKLIQEEADKMIQHYANLSKIADDRKTKINQYLQTVSTINLGDNFIEKEQSKHSGENLNSISEKSNTSSDTFYSAPEEDRNVDDFHDVPPVEELDIINANADIIEDDREDNVAVENTKLEINTTKITDDQNNQNIQQAIDNFEMARQIKQKVLNQELGIIVPSLPKIMTKPKPDTSHLTDAQRNKLRVLSSEFGITLAPNLVKPERSLTALQINRAKVLGTNECLQHKKLDNENYLNKNITENITVKKSQSLSLDFNKIPHEKPTPMSVDSTPMSEPISDLPLTPSTTFMSIDTAQLSSLPNTADTQTTEPEFEIQNQVNTFTIPIYQKKSDTRCSIHAKNVFSKRVTPSEALGITNSCLKLFLHESVAVPVLTQLRLGNNELLKYFITDLKYIDHLISLRDYFFLQDGEFGRNMTENLFSKLYEASFPADLINCRTLHHLVFGAVDISSKHQENSQNLSFKINSLPKCFDLGNPDVLNCLSLTYKVQWPLNILLPTETISKYDDVFKYLLKLNRISWVLKKIFLEMKVLAKETGKKEIYLMSSPHYRKLHQCRHVMTHFVQTLQNYIIGHVLQPSWDTFEKSLKTVTNLDDLYKSHTTYLKNILFMCLLNQKTAVLRNVIQKIFVVILKFYDYLRSRSWKCEDGFYVHPNFDKLESIFQNFEEFVQYLFRVGRKVAKRGYQPHLTHLLDILNINDHYCCTQNTA